MGTAHQNEVPLERKIQQNEISSERIFSIDERRNSQALYVSWTVVSLLKCAGLFEMGTQNICSTRGAVLVYACP